MRRVGAPVLLALLSLVVATFPAQAGVGWCFADPIVYLNGTRVQIEVAIPEQYLPAVNGPIDVRISTPRGVHRRVTYLDSGFNGYGETVTFGNIPGASVNRDGSFDTVILVKVPMDSSSLRPSWKVPVMAVVTIDGVPRPVIATGHQFATTVTVKIPGAK